MLRKTRKTTLLLIFALTLIALFGSFSTAGASGSVAAEGLGELPQVASSTESGEPEIKDIEPDEGEPGQTLDVAITGENTHFNATSEVSFSPPNGITVNSTTVHDATSLTVNIAIADDAPVGKRDVTVTTVITDGVAEVITKEHGFKVKEANDPEEVELKGIITSISPGTDPATGTITVETVSLTPVTPITWTVHINADTRIRIGREHEEGTIADLAVGQRVEVEGILQDDGSVLARKIHVKQNDDEQVGFRGTIIAKSSEVTTTPPLTLTIQMGSRTLTVVTDENTEIEDANGQPITFADLQVGQQIKGKGTLLEDGRILASEIEVVEDPGHERVRFEGVITGLPDGGLVGEWTVRTTAVMTVTFSVDENTKIRPPEVRPEVGDWAKVTAVRREDGTILALKVHIRDGDHPHLVEFRGTIVEMEGDPPRKIVVNVWGHNEYADVAGALVDVLINNQTHIEGELRVGAHVKVQGFLLDNRSVLAKLIVVKHPEVEFRGRIESIEDSVWIVSGITVLITDTTTITGVTPLVGLVAEVKGTRVGPRTVHATEIEVKDPSLEPVKIRGIIKTLPLPLPLPVTVDHIGTWTITTEDGNDVSIEVTADTVIDTRHGEVKEGALVRVTALPQDDGSLVAHRIKVFESD